MLSNNTAVRLEFPSTYEDVRALSEAIAVLLAEARDVDPGDSYNVQLAAHEVCTNQVDHAYGGRTDGLIRATLTLAQRPRRLVIELEDTGTPFDPASAVAPDLDEPQEGGYGLFLAHALMDEVTYQRKGDKNRWRLVKQL